MPTRRDPRTNPRPASEARELRIVSLRPELRADAGAAGDGPIPFRGTAIVYDTWTEIADWWFGSFMERIAPGAAAETIAADDIRLLINHDPNLVLARRRGDAADTLRFIDSPSALTVEAELAPTTYGRDLALSLERGDVTGMSFGFQVLAEEWTDRPDGMWMRTITRLQMFDASIVTYPAYGATEASLRSFLAAVPALRVGRRNSASDAAIIRAAVDALRAQADELEGILGEEAGAGETNSTDPPAETLAGSRAAQARRTSAFAAVYGLGRAS